MKAVLVLCAALAAVTRSPARGAPSVEPALASAAWIAAGVAYHDGRPAHGAAALAGRLGRGWSVPWVYGAMMARRQGLRDEAAALLVEGHAAVPDDPTIPALLGALLLADGDRAGAATWYRRAAEIPGVPADFARFGAALDDR